MDLLLNTLGLEQSRQVLYDFVDHRSDWWALTRGQADAVTFAYERLRHDIGTDESLDPCSEFFEQKTILQELADFQALLQKQPGKFNNESADYLTHALNETNSTAARFEAAWSAYFTKDNEPRSRKLTKTMAQKLGDTAAQRFIELHEKICERLIALRRQQHAVDTLRLSRAWMICGDVLLSQFQDLKQTQRILDFADLEWNSYLLLNAASHADWIQYKLDRRIDHLLVDEFQDTNPTQWQLLLPLLQELAAGESERRRSVLFVGDGKQSIYSFRRAEPRLFDAASDWLHEHLPDARRQSLSKSWRSSPAIMNFVNRLFTDNPSLQLPHFEIHATAHESLYGRVCLLPMIQKDKKPAADGLRNPLTTPRPQIEAAQYFEAQRIADSIKDLIDSHTLVGHPGRTRVLRYADIMLLFRSRTRVYEYERALREAHIPYIGTERGTLLDSLEIRDMLNLLQWLITPFDNLALAGILRSPLFAASDQDLMRLAGKGDWYARLRTLAPELEPEHALARAARNLQAWIPLADRLPVHDLLDRIYSETNIYARYRAAFPEHLHPRIMANLVRFLELALETDSGRYPSLTRFMVWLELLRQQEREAPDQPPGAGEQDRVRLLTVHEAKGLEAAVVFVADASREAPTARGARTLVEWPATADAPQSFVLSPAEKDPNTYCESVMTRLQEKAEQEDANLLYVALTRAEQHLYISAADKSRGWYQEICRVYAIDSDSQTGTVCLEQHGQSETQADQRQSVTTEKLDVPPGLREPIELPPVLLEIAPSYRIQHRDMHSTGLDEDARERGIIIHSMLEALAQDPGQTLTGFIARHGSVERTQLSTYWAEARAVISSFPQFFDPENFRIAYNEVPIVYAGRERNVHGVIDRLVCYPDKIIVLDYKSHRLEPGTDLATAAGAFQEQLRLYAEGVRRCYPQTPVECQILFTALPQCVAVSA